MKTLVVLCFILIACCAKAQTLYRYTSSPQNNAVCPNTEIRYMISGADSRCGYTWETNSNIEGAISYQQTDKTVADIKWQDKAGGEAKVEVTQVQKPGQRECPYLGQKLSITESIMSVAGESIPTNPTNPIDYCETDGYTILITLQYIKSKNNPWEWQAEYQWELPSGWRDDAGHNGLATFTTVDNYVRIIPQLCSESATVRVWSKVPGCANAGLSNPASIPLNASKPTMGITAPSGTKLTICNTTNITLTAGVTPTLDCASGVNWTTPTGWTKVSQSGNTATFTPSGSDRAEVTINASASFTCGSSVGNSITIPYEAPAISGLGTVCSSETYSVTNIEPSVAIQWSSNSTGLSISSSGVATRNNSFNGEVIITANISSAACGTIPLTKTVSVGEREAIIRHTFDERNCNNGEVFFAASAFGSIATNWSWSAHGEGVRFVFAQNNETVYGFMTAREIPIILYYTDACGERRGTSIKLVNPCSVANARMRRSQQMAEITAFPNPASTELTVEISKEVDKLDEGAAILLLNQQGIGYYNTSTDAPTVRIPVADIPRGIYFLHIYCQEKIQKKQILLE